MAGCGRRSPSVLHRLHINPSRPRAIQEIRPDAGMFVAAGAREQFLAVRRKLFAEQYVDPMVAEASRLGIDSDTLVSLIRESSGITEATRDDPDDLGDGA